MTKLLAILKDAAMYQASDVHIVRGRPIFMRVRGEINTMRNAPISSEEVDALLEELLTPDQKRAVEERRGFSFSLMDFSLGRLRVTVSYERGLAELSVRFGKTKIPTLAESGVPAELANLIKQRSGLILISGLAGMGKTSTLNALVNEINDTRRVKVVTIENPVEYMHTSKKSLIVQQDVLIDVPSFSTALTQVLRQDPDVICIGEMMDLETIATGLMAAETGHLVIATVHAPHTILTIDRVVNVFSEDIRNLVMQQLANCLLCILCQELLPRKSGEGRVLATELLVATDPVRALIREGKTHQIPSAMGIGSRDGMHTFEQSLTGLHEKGLLADEVYATRLKRKGGGS